MKYAGVKNVSVLSGGFESRSIREKRPVTEEVTRPKSAAYKGKFDKNLLATKSYVQSRLGKALIVDTREPDFFNGKQKLPCRQGGPNCRRHLRKECERLLRVKLLETYTVGEGIKGLIKPINLETLINRLKEFYEDLGLEPPTNLIDSLQNYKSILFNPMSHSDIVSPIYRNDFLELAFRTIQDLEAIVLPKRTLLIEKGGDF